MSEDWVVRAPQRADADSVFAALGRAAPGARIEAATTGRHLLVVEAGAATVWVSSTHPAFGPIEEARLLFRPRETLEPCPWWTEVSGPAHARERVAAVARSLARSFGGVADRCTLADEDLNRIEELS